MTTFSKAISLLAVLAFCGSAAAESKTEFFYQVEQDKFELEPSVSVASEKTTMKAGGTDEDESLTQLNIKGEFGLNEMLSLGFNVPYALSGTAVVEGDEFDVKGLGNLGLFVKGYTAAGPGSVRFGADLSLATGNGEVDDTAKEATLNDGSMFLTPYVGYLYEMGEQNFAAKLSYGVRLGDTKYDIKPDGTTEETSGAQPIELALGWEMNYGMGMFGVALEYLMVSESENKAGVGLKNGFTDLTLRPYVAHSFAENMTVVGSFGYATNMSHDTTTVDGKTGTELEVGLRYMF